MRILFLLYYCKLRLSVLLGLHHTRNPLTFNYRWKHWQYELHRRKFSR